MFDAKSYNDVRNVIGIANGVYAILLLLLIYYLILTPSHSTFVLESLDKLKINPLVSGLITTAGISTIWGYISTVVFRLHDRLYEPHFVKWRAFYETDFILRELCFGNSNIISRRFFDEAFKDNDKRSAFLQRLFYKFVGDSKQAHEEIRSRFYTLIRNYWIFILAEIYLIFFLIITNIYLSFFSPPLNIFPYLLIAIILSVFIHVIANKYIYKARTITLEQINVVIKEHKEEFEKSLKDIAKDYNLGRY